jgi:hypothetical protein
MRYLPALATTAALATFAARAGAEPAACSSSNPPAPSRPYFMLALDASDSMSVAIPTTNSCKLANGYSTDYPDNRIGHARCAIFNTLSAFGGLVNFGLATFGPRQVSDDAQGLANNVNACPDTMQGQLVLGQPPQPGEGIQGCIQYHLNSPPNTACGPGVGVTRSSANILVPLQQDNYWDPPNLQSASNVPSIASWVDNQCGDCREILLSVNTPINGALRDMYRYLSNQWTNPLTGQTFATPLEDASVERTCRSVNVILLTDGGETCDTTGVTDPNGTSAANAAKTLLDGFDIGPTH